MALCYQKNALPPLQPEPFYLGRFMGVDPQPPVSRTDLPTVYRFEEGTVSVIPGATPNVSVVPCRIIVGGYPKNRKRTRRATRKGRKGRKNTRRH
jgi:hypothetical protein